MSPELMRVLRPKITLKAAIRMHTEYLTRIAITSSTLGMLWWQTYFEVWAEVMDPTGAGK